MQLSLHNGSASGVTVVSNVFLDYYMPRANGEFVKIYLYLLRLLGAGQGELTLAEVADVFSCTETDILRALRYWEAERLLVLSGNASSQTSVDFLEPMVPPKERGVRGRTANPASTGSQASPSRRTSGQQTIPQRLLFRTRRPGPERLRGRKRTRRPAASALTGSVS